MSHFSLWDIKKRASSHEPLASVRKAIEAFLLTASHLLPKNQSSFYLKNFYYL